MRTGASKPHLQQDREPFRVDGFLCIQFAIYDDSHYDGEHIAARNVAIAMS